MLLLLRGGGVLLILPICVIGEMNGGVVSLELKLVASVTMLDTNNLLFWLYIHVPATIEFCFVVARITNAVNTHLYCPSALLVK
jgi:hypothetical protein